MRHVFDLKIFYYAYYRKKTSIIVLSTTNWLLPRTFAICLYGDWTLQLLTFSVPCRECRVGREALCALGTLMFSELTSWSQSLHLLISRKALNPFMVTSAPCDQQKVSCKESDWLHWTPPSPKSYILTFPHYLFGAVSQSCPRCCLPGCSPHFAPIKLNLQPSHWASF